MSKNSDSAKDWNDGKATEGTCQVDVLCTYADARRDYEEKWKSEYGRAGSIWEETNVIGVTPPIFNDTVSVSMTSKIMEDDFKKAVQNAFINIGNTEDRPLYMALCSSVSADPAHLPDF